MSSSNTRSSSQTSFFLRILPVVVWSLGCSFYFYEFLLQVSLGVIGTELMRDFSITSQTLGVLSAFFYLSYAPMQMPCGILMDHYGPHRILTIATAICAVSTIAFGMTDNFYMACFARFMIGLGSAFAVVGTMKLAANWFPANRFALLTGLLITIGMLGAVGGEAPMAHLVSFLGWRRSMILIGSVGIVLALLIYMIAQDKPTSHSQDAHDAPHIEQEPMLKSLIALLGNAQLWLVAIYGGLMYMATPVICGMWGVPFLTLKMHVVKETAANYISLIFFGWAIASPLWGIYSNRIGRRKPPMYIGTVGSLIALLLVIYAPIESSLLMQALLLSFGLFSAGFLSSFSVAKELCNSHYVATGLGFMNMINMVGVLVAQPLIGHILDKLWSGTLADGVRVYPLNAFSVGLSILPAGIFIALIILPFVKETFCKSVEERALER